MTYKVAALYQFVDLPDYQELRQPLHTMCKKLEIQGTLLLAREGINGTVAGTEKAIDTLIEELLHGSLFKGRLDNVELKFSQASSMPFKRLKVRLKKEIVALGKPHINPAKQVGTYIEPQDWNALISDPEILLIDTRNSYEIEKGTFQQALDPETETFNEFPTFVKQKLDPKKHKKVAMFCTGGIRCEKASAYMLSQGFEEVYHLKGGILKYLETIEPEQSLWQGSCFVFDDRIALEHGLKQAQ